MTESYSRRSFLSGVLACGTLTAAATWFIPGGRSPSDPTEGHLRLATGDSSGTWKVLTDLWSQSNPKARVEVTGLQGQTDDVKNIMYEHARSGRVDLVNLDVIHIAKFFHDGLIEPIRLTSPSTFLSPMQRVSLIPGETNRYWAAPFYADVGMLFSRRDFGIPSSSLPELVGKLAKKSKDLVIQLDPTNAGAVEPFVVNVWEQALAQDDGLVGDNGCPSFDLERWENALRALQVAIKDERIEITAIEGDSTDLFSSSSDGRPSFMRNWPSAYRDLQVRRNVDVQKGKVQVRPLNSESNRGVGVLGGRSLALVARSPNKAQAQEFIDFATSVPAQKILAHHGLVSPRIDVYSDSGIQAAIPHLQMIRQAAEAARLRPVTPRYQEFSAAVHAHVYPFLFEERKLTRDFVDDMRKALDCR